MRTPTQYSIANKTTNHQSIVQVTIHSNIVGIIALCVDRIACVDQLAYITMDTIQYEL